MGPVREDPGNEQRAPEPAERVPLIGMDEELDNTAQRFLTASLLGGRTKEP